MEPLLTPASDDVNEGLGSIIGIGAVWLFLGTALFYVWSYPHTPLGYGTALAVTFIPTIVTVGGHEAAHYVVADEYCDYEQVHFSAFVSTTALTLASVGGALLLVGLDMFGVWRAPSWLLMFGIVSPGAVIAKGQSDRRQCFDETALAGPLFNFLLGMGLLFVVYDGVLVLPMHGMDFVPLVLSLTTVLSLYLAFFNALPLGPLDGAKVVQAREPVTMSILFTIIGVSGWMLFSPLL